MKKLFIVYLGLVLSLVGCSTHSGVKALQENTQLFQQSIRWASLQAASNLMDPRHKSELLDYFGKWVEKNKTVEFTIVGTTMYPSKDKADIWVDYSYYEIVHETLMKKRQKQSWVVNPETKSWMITSVE